MSKAPRAGLATFAKINDVYYGTDDGFAELRPREETCHDAAHVAALYEIYARYEQFYHSVVLTRRDQIHFVSVVGGLYGLNLIPIFRPKQITLVDVNPHQITFFNLIRRAWIASASCEQFLGKLTNASYEVDTDEERFIQTCIAARQKGTLADEQGCSARTFRSSWRYALDHFELTRRLLVEVPVETRVEGMHTASFASFLANNENLWIYLSNVILFVFFDLHFQYPRNVALFANYFDRTELLDLHGTSSGPVSVHCRLPMSIANY